MTDAPERKYLAPNGGLPTGNWEKSDLLGYVRPDLYDAQAARIAELEAVLEIAERALHEHDTANYGWDEENPWTMGEWFSDNDRDTIAKARLIPTRDTKDTPPQ